MHNSILLVVALARCPPIKVSRCDSHGGQRESQYTVLLGFNRYIPAGAPCIVREEEAKECRE
jgi:hypothetical protein